MQIPGFRIATPALATWFSLLIVCGPPVVTADSVLPSFERVRLFDSPRMISDLELIDQDGHPFRMSELRGRVVLVFFGFTHCPDICPLTMAKFRQFEESGDVDLEKVAFVLVSVDSERDTPAVLKAYLEKFSPRFIGLTGNPDEINALAKDFSASFFPENPSANNGDYSVAHSRQAFVLDPTGQLRAEFYSPSIEAMTGVTVALLSESNTPKTDSAN